MGGMAGRVYRNTLLSLQLSINLKLIKSSLKKYFTVLRSRERGNRESKGEYKQEKEEEEEKEK